MHSSSKVLNRLMKQCSRREYCSSAIYKKACEALAGKSPEGYSLPVTEEIQVEAARIVAKLVSDGFISDRRYAEAYAREKAEISGWGPIKIKMNLAAQGLPKDIIEESLDGAFSSGAAHKKALKVISVKRKALGDDPQWKIKLLRFALSRGYSYEDATKLIDET